MAFTSTICFIKVIYLNTNCVFHYVHGFSNKNNIYTLFSYLNKTKNIKYIVNFDKVANVRLLLLYFDSVEV